MTSSGTPLDRRTALLALASTLGLAACGGGSSTPAPASPAPPTPTMPRLKLSGSQMSLPDGSTVILRGMNEGTWGEMRSGDAAMIQGNGAKVVRLLIRWWGLYGGTDVESRLDAPGAAGHFDPAHVTRLLTEIQWCIDAGLWVVVAIDSNCGQNGNQDAAMAAYCDPSGKYPGGRNFWTDLTQRQLFKEAWIYLAGLLKGYRNIAMLELLPEPLEGYGSSYGDDVSAFYQELMVAIEDLAGDTTTPFLIGARDAYNINLCDEAYIPSLRWKDRVVYTGNLFIHVNAAQDAVLANLDARLGALSTMKSTRNVPVFIQQFGVRTGDDPDGFYLDAGLSRMNAAGIGYTGWQWRQNTTNPDEYAIVVADPNTGADVVKTDVLALYSTYWKA